MMETGETVPFERRKDDVGSIDGFHDLSYNLKFG